MANIHIKELFGSDNITALTEKVNFNFDQLILAGGGPQGPIGESGASGPVGPGGVRGSQWIGASGSAGVSLPTDGVFRENDFKLNPNGDVDYYVSSAFVTTGINLQGPKGDKGGSGDGAIQIVPGKLESVNSANVYVPNLSGGTAAQSPSIGTYINAIQDNDADDYKSGAAYYNAGVDFNLIGRGNNSLVLGRYATLFDTGLTGPKFQPPGDGTVTNAIMSNFPTSESDVPMLYISQNDYKDPSRLDNTYTNGISIGLTRSQPNSLYNTSSKFRFGMNFQNNSNISIENQYHDLRIKTGDNSNSGSKHLTLSAGGGTTSFRLGSSLSRGSSIDNYSTKLDSEIYTNFKLGDSFFTDLSDSNNDTSGKEFITNAQTTFFQNNKFYESDKDNTVFNDTRKKIAKTFIGSNDELDGGANELVFVNGDSLTNTTNVKKITRSIDPTTYTNSSGTQTTTFEQRSVFDSNNRNFAFRIGQTTVQPGRMTGINADGTPTIDPNYSNKINITYQGQGYDTPFIQYSGIDLENTYNGSISSGGYKGYAPYAVIPNDGALEKVLGYDIFDPIGFSNDENRNGSRSMSRMGIYPGFFRRDKTGGFNSGGATYVGDADARQKKFFDVAHRMMPTGSLDVFGTVRIREQETTDSGAKDGWIAVNKKDGILGFQEPNTINAVPTFSVMMFPEMASNRFSFYTTSRKAFGASSTTAANKRAHDYVKGTTNSPFAAFPGKGSHELTDYYICNGAVLADARDILVTGPFSKMRGMNVEGDDGKEWVENGFRRTSVFPTEFNYEPNADFEPTDGEPITSIKFENASGENIADRFCRWFNDNADPTPGVTHGINRMVSGTRTASWGYSVLGGRDIESGFRVVLPNYFGKVAKMQFPDSEFIVRAISGTKLSSNDPDVNEKNDHGYIYHNTNSRYNTQWMLRGMFENGGFPYIQGNQLPKMQLPKHGHDTGNIHLNEPSSAQESNEDYGAHFHRSSLVEASTATGALVGFAVRGYCADGNGTAGNCEYKVDGKESMSAHRHNSEQFDGFTGETGDFEMEGVGYYISNDIDNYRVTGTGNGSNKFKVTKAFGYDASYTNATYSRFSNWMNYTRGNTNEADTSGQKFFSPPFKGTIMAINLKGLKNPNRNNTTIKDLHYVAGVPMCGAYTETHDPGKPVTPYAGDMSWWSWADEEVKLDADGTRPVPGTYDNWNPVESSKAFDLLSYYEGFEDVFKYMGRTYANAYEYGFKSMSRNDDTMHPYTYVDNNRFKPGNDFMKGRGREAVSHLDYNTYLSSEMDRNRYNLYKTNITRENDFDV